VRGGGAWHAVRAEADSSMIDYKRVSLRRPARRGLGQVPTLVVLQKFAKVFFV
jgi:hypothetical protein